MRGKSKPHRGKTLPANFNFDSMKIKEQRSIRNGKSEILPSSSSSSFNSVSIDLPPTPSSDVFYHTVLAVRGGRKLDSDGHVVEHELS